MKYKKKFLDYSENKIIELFINKNYKKKELKFEGFNLTPSVKRNLYVLVKNSFDKNYREMIKNSKLI